ncbi:Rhodanese-like domain-containing protein [Phycomyces nitens]|nr:Rhodanese-like domain-containing protein [Phycomyces nitens]
MFARRFIKPLLASARVPLKHQTIPTIAPRVNPIWISSIRTYSLGSQGNQNGFVVFEDIQKLIKENDKSCHLIDVREPAEVIQGSIPTAKNVPLSQFVDAWQSSDDLFEKQFGFKKPSEKETLVVYCMAGIRSARAADYLRQNGYEDVRNYAGSWADYAEKSRA